MLFCEDFDLIWPSVNPRLIRGILVILVEKGTLGALVSERVVPCHFGCSHDPMERNKHFWIFWGSARKSRAVKIWYQHRLESEADSLKKFKESSWTLGQEVIELKAKLSGVTHQADKLMKENANLKSEVATLHEHMDKVKEKAIEEFQVSQPYFNKIGGYCEDGFEDFDKQAVLLFTDLDFS